MATPLEESKKEVQIGHTQTNTYNLVQDRENRSSESWDNLSTVKKKETRKRGKA